MRRLSIMGGLLGIAMLVASSCGDIGGSGQCGGAESSGICASIVSIVPTDTLNGVTTSDVDATQDPCTATGTGTGTGSATVEKWGEHAAIVTFSANLLPGVTAPPAASFVTFNQYSIVYTASPAGTAGPPMASFTGGAPTTITVTTTGTVTVTLTLVSIAQKKAYVAAGGSLTTPSAYTATLTFTGTDEFGKSVSIQGETQFFIGNYATC